LNPSVVPLIKDLNGNHVIQKCLHRLSADHRQFIYDAITNNCIEVATHKHGCCVLQRCIDYASPSQKVRRMKTDPDRRWLTISSWIRLSWWRKSHDMLFLWCKISTGTMLCSMYWKLAIVASRMDSFDNSWATPAIFQRKNLAQT
jgi:hypothetical protein